jgi:MFS superfamily sulfate permease-like transporter
MRYTHQPYHSPVVAFALIPCLVVILRSSVCCSLPSHIIPLVLFLFLQSHYKEVTYSQVIGDCPTIYRCLPVTQSFKTAQTPWPS